MSFLTKIEVHGCLCVCVCGVLHIKIPQEKDPIDLNGVFCIVSEILYWSQREIVYYWGITNKTVLYIQSISPRCLQSRCLSYFTMTSRQSGAFVAPFQCSQCQPHPCSNSPHFLCDLLEFHGEMQVSQHKMVHLSKLHQHLFPKTLSHFALDISCSPLVLWRQQPASAQVWSSSHNSREPSLISILSPFKIFHQKLASPNDLNQ